MCIDRMLRSEDERTIVILFRNFCVENQRVRFVEPARIHVNESTLANYFALFFYVHILALDTH